MNQLKLAFKKVVSYLPSKLPVGMAEFDTFAQDVLDLSGQYADRSSMLFAIASMIIHLPAGRGTVPKNQLVQGLRKSAANQVASQVFQDIKKAMDLKLAEDTAAAKAKAASDEAAKQEETKEASNS